MRLLLLIFLTAITQPKVWAFNSDYESQSSYDGRSLTSARTIFNAPYSLCRMDGIADSACKQVSLSLGGETFKNVYFSEAEGNKPKSYFESIGQSSLENLVKDYKLEGISDKQWLVPTLGQLTSMMSSGYIPKVYGRKYWYRSDSTNALKIATYGYSPSSGSSAGIYRLATLDQPSSCREEDCSPWSNSSPWILQTNTGSSFAIRYNYGYKVNGKSFKWTNQWGRNALHIPGGASDVYIEIWHHGAPGWSGRNYNIERQRGAASTMCITQYGSLFVTSADLTKGACW
ncbi:hypothetical protein [Vibrio sp. N418]|uniref:hypothetical protein n=1 Tax=Vibrio sp. (strain N418) TaxID=701176 RepID=UPI000317B1E0|nr:hypothetical protein [Vibrio sp. N418]